MLLVESKRPLDRLIANDITVREVLGDDATARLVFLLETVLLCCILCSRCLVACKFIEGLRTTNVYRVRAKLGVV